MDRPPPPATHEAFRGARSSELLGHSKKVHAVAWNCTGRKLASGSVDKTVRIWDIHHGKGDKAEAELKGHTGAPHGRAEACGTRAATAAFLTCALLRLRRRRGPASLAPVPPRPACHRERR